MGLLDDVVNGLKHIGGEAENPLRVIGLSKEVLGLGLSNNELHTFCLRRARDLLMLFHEDTRPKTSITADLQAKYSAAFTKLKKFDDFANYVREFSMERSEDRSEKTFLHRSIREHREILDRLRTSEALVRKENDNLKERQHALYVNLSTYLRARVSALSFPEDREWVSKVPLNASGQIAVLSARIPDKKDQGDQIVVDEELKSRIEKGTRILKNLDILSEKSKRIFVNIYPYRNGKIFYHQPVSVLGCVDGRAKNAFETERYAGTAWVTFQEVEMFALLQPFLFFPGIIVQPTSDQTFQIHGNPEQAITRLRDKVRIKYQKKRVGYTGVKFNPQYLFLGFKADE